MPEISLTPAKIAIPCFRHGHCIDLAYHDLGTGEPLLLIHGLGSNSSGWCRQLEELSAYCRLITPDLRGHGASGHRPEEPVTIRAFAEDLIALLKALGLERVHCCGHSLGGLVALEIWVRAPFLIKSLILAGTAAFFPPPQMLEEFLRLVDHLDLTAVVRLMAPRLLAPKSPEVLVEEMVQMVSAVSRAAYRQALVAAFQADYRWMLPLVEVPTLVVAGVDDQATPVGYACFLEKHIPRAVLQLVPEAGHLPHRENPQEFNRLVREHLEECLTA